MKRIHVVGLIVGGFFGAVISFAGSASVIFGFPGVLVAVLTGALAFHSTGGGWLAVVVPVNAAASTGSTLTPLPPTSRADDRRLGCEPMARVQLV